MDNFIDSYLTYTRETEPQRIYHRWCAIASISAILGRNVHLPFGHQRIFPNIYCMLLGESGSRKSTAIKIAKKLLEDVGYDHFSADKTSKEKFLLDLEGAPEEEIVTGGRKTPVYDSITAANLWGSESYVNQEPKEVFIVADEFNEFIGLGNLEFCSTLGTLWDWDSNSRPFTSRLKNSRSVTIWQPTVTILGGNTQDNYAKAFPTDIIGQGFLARLLHIYGERSERKYTIMPTPSPAATAEILSGLKDIRAKVHGVATYSPEAFKVLAAIYDSWKDLSDLRFKSYSNRRFAQLLKLTLNTAASKFTSNIDEQSVISANTILSAAEILMPAALGEFGKGKNSDIAHKIVELLESSNKPVTQKEIWKEVHKDLNKPSELTDILNGLLVADRIQYARNLGWLPNRIASKKPDFVDWNLLTEEERSML